MILEILSHALRSVITGVLCFGGLESVIDLVLAAAVKQDIRYTGETAEFFMIKSTETVNSVTLKW